MSIRIDGLDWITAVACVASVAGIIFSLTKILLLPRATSSKEVIAFVLRVSALVCLLGFLARLSVKAKTNPKDATIHVLIDASGSMEEDLRQLKKTTRTIENWAKSHGWKLRLFRAGTKLREVKSVQEALRAPLERRTAISSSLAELAGVLPPQSCVLVLSDGVETENSEPPKTNLGIFAIAFGETAAEDIVLEDVQFPPVVFARGGVPFKFILRYPQGARETLPIVIRDAANQEVLWMSLVTLSGFSPQQFELNLNAGKDVGKKRWILEAGPASWEKRKFNNHKTFSLEVRRDKLRVLFLAGKPSFDYSYLRDFLRSQSERELVSFVILRNPEDAPPFGESELSLIPFPAQDIFLKSLGEFDLFILQDFSFTRFGLPPIYTERILDFVKSGGGLILMLGPNTLNADEYGPVLQELFGAARVPTNNYEEGSFDFAINNKDFWNTTFNYHLDPKQNLEIWRSAAAPINGLEALLVNAGGAPGAQAKSRVLATAGDAGGNHPLIIFGEQGKGRAVLQSFTGTWLWKAKQGVAGSYHDIYDNFWASTIRWVTKETKLSLAQEKPLPSVPTEDPEFRESVDYDYLGRLTAGNEGAILGDASQWVDRVPPNYEEKIVKFLEREDAPPVNDKNSRGFSFGGNFVMLAAGFLMIEWFLRRL